MFLVTKSKNIYVHQAAVEAWGACLRLEMRRWGVDVVIVETGEYVSGNAWLKDNSSLLEQAREMWTQLDRSMA